jgi:hypothetical protein
VMRPTENKECHKLHLQLSMNPLQELAGDDRQLPKKLIL